MAGLGRYPAHLPSINIERREKASPALQTFGLPDGFEQCRRPAACREREFFQNFHAARPRITVGLGSAWSAIGRLANARENRGWIEHAPPVFTDLTGGNAARASSSFTR